MLDAAETASSDFDAVADWEIDATVSAGDHFLGSVGRGRISVVLRGAAGSPYDPKQDQQQTYPEQVFHGLRGGFQFPQSITEACSIVTGDCPFLTPRTFSGKKKAAIVSDHGFSRIQLVGARGFEPPTPTSRT